MLNMDTLSFLCRITIFYDENIVLGNLACTIKLQREKMRRAKDCIQYHGILQC